MAFHAGSSANTSSIAIEICMNSGIDHAQANDRAARLVAVLLFDLNLTVDKVRTHKSWTNKNCPRRLLSNDDSLDWNGFVGLVSTHLSSITSVPSPDIVSMDLDNAPDEAAIAAQTISAEVQEDIQNDVDHEAMANSLRESQ